MPQQTAKCQGGQATQTPLAGALTVYKTPREDNLPAWKGAGAQHDTSLSSSPAGSLAEDTDEMLSSSTGGGASVSAGIMKGGSVGQLSAGPDVSGSSLCLALVADQVYFGAAKVIPSLLWSHKGKRSALHAGWRLLDAVFCMVEKIKQSVGQLAIC